MPSCRADETRRFADVVANLPADIVEDGDVGTARHREREYRQHALTDGVEETEDKFWGDSADENPVNGIYRIVVKQSNHGSNTQH